MARGKTREYYNKKRSSKFGCAAPPPVVDSDPPAPQERARSRSRQFRGRFRSASVSSQQRRVQRVKETLKSSAFGDSFTQDDENEVIELLLRVALGQGLRNQFLEALFKTVPGKKFVARKASEGR
jgi:hypothetical protein